MEESKEILSVRLERDELHRWIGGGIPRGSTMLIEGGQGSGKSILSERLLFGFLSNDLTCSYLSTELPLTGFLKQMMSLDYDVTMHLLRGSLHFASSYLTMTRGKRVEDPLVSILRNKFVLERDVVILDSFDSLIYGTGRSQKDVLELTSFLKRLCSTGMVLILTADPNRSDPNLIEALENVSDVSVRLEAKQMASALKRKMTIVRFLKPGSRFTNMIGFRVEPGVGFVIEISTVA